MIDEALLHQSPYFEAMGVEEFALIVQHAQGRTLSDGELILLQGQPAEALYFVQEGRVRVYASTPEGREQVLFMPRPGDTFNDVTLFDGGTNLASAQAIAPATVVVSVPRAILGPLLLANPHVAAGAVHVLTCRVRQLARLVEDLALRDTTQRVARLLLEEGSASGEVTLTREEMASRVGTVREVVSRTLRTLERSGAVIRYTKHAVRVDAAALGAVMEPLPPERDEGSIFVHSGIL
jgi:CRP/FNR family cyclic AMP-dependent transcriptional regulator